ncbi:MAG: alpha/beta fold hydrolase [Alphaproteobacteria bacterium]|nr:alpha/beta fold hydrolase [Alphaproteobacteria bacterium]
MALTPSLQGPSMPPATGGGARQLVILLHGVGADGNDLIGLAPILARTLPHARFVSPNAPYRYDLAPQGHQWFSLRDRSPASTLAGVRQTAPILNAFIDQQLAALKLGDESLALVGFSQGTMMALYVALRRARTCAGVLGYSGRLVGAETPRAEVTARPPICLIHGTHDELIPVESMLEAADALGAAEVPTRWHIRPGLGHGIDEEGLAIGADFLRNALALPRA